MQRLFMYLVEYLVERYMLEMRWKFLEKITVFKMKKIAALWLLADCGFQFHGFDFFIPL